MGKYLKKFGQKVNDQKMLWLLFKVITEIITSMMKFAFFFENSVNPSKENQEFKQLRNVESSMAVRESQLTMLTLKLKNKKKDQRY